MQEGHIHKKTLGLTPIRFVVTLIALGLVVLSPGRTSFAGQSADKLGGPNSVAEELREEGRSSGLARWNGWKDALKDRTGFDFDIEYSTSVQAYNESAADEDFSAGGIFRVFGAWELVGRGTENPGRLVFRIDHRHRYTELAPQDAGFAAGSALPTSSLYSDRGWGIVNLQWVQAFAKGRAGIVFGLSPADDYFHAYALANPLTAFSNLAFSIGSVIPIPDTGMALAAGGMLGDHFYVKAGVHDANGDANDPSLDVFGDWELYKNLEIGWTPDQDALYLKNVHLGVWHVDERDEAGVPDGWGITANASWHFEDSNWLPFLRGGWASGEATLLDAQVSAGVARKFRKRDLLGVGISWGSPSGDGGDQWTSELFYRIQIRNLAITPVIQLVANPALNPDEDLLVVGGVRVRIVF
jgi:porin